MNEYCNVSMQFHTYDIKKAVGKWYSDRWIQDASLWIKFSEVMLKKSLEEDKRKGDETSGEWNREKKRGEEIREEERGLDEVLDSVRKEWKTPR